jgi:SAM-dependent methyltransferase
VKKKGAISATTTAEPLPCPLCGIGDTAGTDAGWQFYACSRCGLVFRHPHDYPDAATEKAHYDLHENDPSDPGYLAFLRRCTEPLVAFLQLGEEGLDFGCGPGPAVDRLLPDQKVHRYDPFYFPDRKPLARRYDFLVCTETAEHFHDPAASWHRLFGLLRPGGRLAVMTRLLEDPAAVAGWWYSRDPTHVVFYREATFRWLAERFCARLDRPHRDVALFHR